jgi:hypothetical protein
MEFLSVEDWLDNSKWFDIKLVPIAPVITPVSSTANALLKP